MTRTFNPFKVLLAAGVMTGTLFAAAANAANSVPTHDGIAVHYSAAELTSDAATQHLYRRLELAAREACGDGPTLRSLNERIQENRCVEKVLANAVAKINQPMLTSLHASRSNKVG